MIARVTYKINRVNIKINGFDERKLSIKYLWIFITTGRYLFFYCQILVDSVSTGIREWHNKHVSYARSVTLIDGLLRGIYDFWTSRFIFP